MYKNYRNYHLFRFLSFWDISGGPLDLALSRYGKKEKSLGAKDRKFLGDTVYALVRNQLLLDEVAANPRNRKKEEGGIWERRYQLWQEIEKTPSLLEGLPPWIRYSVPQFIWDATKDMDSSLRERLFSAMLKPAPITIRANLSKITRDALFDRLQTQFTIFKSKRCEAAIHFEKREPLFSLPEFSEGLFEMQDEGSQEVANLIAIKPKESLLDFCAGSGGKSLAIAHKMQGSGQIYLHDIRKEVLYEAKKRFKRASVFHAQPLFFDEIEKKKKLHGKMDWVIVDAPCSGTGTFRRNPEMKARLTQLDIDRLIEIQRTIFDAALPFVKKGGTLLYSTCSFLPQENEEQVAFFLKSYPVKQVKSIKTELPSDILFGALFQFI